LSAAWPLLLAGALAAQAGDAHVSVTNTFSAEAHVDNANGQGDDDDYTILFDRLNLVGGAGDLGASARLDLVSFFDKPSAAYRSDVRLERASVQLPLGELLLTAGDSYQQLGRGIVLSMRKADEVSLDIALRGAAARYRGARQEARWFAGVANAVNLDPVSQKHIEDADDFLAGSAYELRPVDWLALGAHALYAQPEERLLEHSLDRSYSAGLYAELPDLFGLVSLYAEVDAQQRLLAGEPGMGSGGTLSADFRADDTGLLLEGLFLEEFEQRGSRNSALQSRFDYNRPPTLERLQEEVLNNRDVVGGRLRVEHYLAPLDLLLFVNAMIRLNERDAPSELRQGHAYGGAEWYFQSGASRLAASGGYRDEQQTNGRTHKTMVHAEGEYLQALGEGLSLHLSTLNELRSLNDADYVRGSSFAGLEWSYWGSLTFELGYDNQNPVPEVRKFFFAGVLSVEVIEEVKLRATAGTRRGGIKCIAGVCREFPPFAGVAGELVARL